MDAINLDERMQTIDFKKFLLQCPRCKARATYENGTVVCSACGAPFPVVDGTLRCIESERDVTKTSFDIQLRNFYKRWPRIYYQEIRRLLVPGGHAYFSVPFLYPYHASPGDYSRWTRPGFSDLLEEFVIVESGVRAGPFSALTAYCCYLFAFIFSFNIEKLFWLLMNLSIFIFFPIKIFDFFVYRWSTAEHLASVMYFVVKKK